MRSIVLSTAIVVTLAIGVSLRAESALIWRFTFQSYGWTNKVMVDLEIWKEPVIYEELRRLNRRMDILEELMEEIILRELPRVKLSEKEIDEIKKSVEEIRRGECAILEELLNA